jgi:hypothetical protein
MIWEGLKRPTFCHTVTTPLEHKKVLETDSAEFGQAKWAAASRSVRTKQASASLPTLAPQHPHTPCAGP